MAKNKLPEYTKIKKKEPMPTAGIENLGKPKASKQPFTYSENKLLDQITIELMEAWKKDLAAIRKTHLECRTLLEDFRDIQRLMIDNKESLGEVCYTLEKLKECSEKKPWWQRWFKPKS